MPPTWLTVVAWISLAGGFLSAGAILYDIYGRGFRQPLRIMEAVWPITALIFGVFGWLSYAGLGRPRQTPKAAADLQPLPQWQEWAISDTHCGAACTLGDIIGEWGIFALGLTIAGVALWPEYIVDFLLAYVFGILFQYFAIKPMSNLSVGEAFSRAIQSDTLTITAFEVGLFGWMAVTFFVLFPHPHLTPDYPAYWLMMQIGMALGLVTEYPVNIWLIRGGIKHRMGRPTRAGISMPGH